MLHVSDDNYPAETLQRLLCGITFFRELKADAPNDFARLLDQVSLTKAYQGSFVMRRGDPASHFYFLLRGELEVLAAESGSASALAEISAGELVGTMAMTLNNRRSATLRVASKQALLLGVDYELLSLGEEANGISLETRLKLFRHVTASLRWNIEKLRMSSPESVLSHSIRSIPVYSGRKDSHEELKYLHQLAETLSTLLCNWNQSLPLTG